MTAQLTSPILVRSTILVALAIAWIRAPVAAIRLPIMLDFQSTAKSVGANLEGIPSTAAPIAVAMLEIPGLNITVHAIQSTSATEILNGTAAVSESTRVVARTRLITSTSFGRLLRDEHLVPLDQIEFVNTVRYSPLACLILIG